MLWLFPGCGPSVPGMNDVSDALGIIAGNRALPLMLARQARQMGVRRLVAVAFRGETDPALCELVDETVWLKVGQLGKLISALKSRGVTRCAMAGQIAPKNLFEVRPDLRALGLLLKLKEKNAHTIFGAFADELRREGIHLVEATLWLEPLMPASGFRLGHKLSNEEQSDAAFGYRIAKEIARLEIGQTVVVKSGVVLSVEGFEGTDRCLARGGELAGREGGAVAVKVAKARHDMRFDIPCMGARTVEVAAEAGISVLALEAGKTLLLEEEQVKEIALQKRVAVITVNPG